MPPGGDPSTETGDTEPHELPLSLDSILDLLASVRRRALLEYLRDQPENTGSFDDAAEYTIQKVGQKHGMRPNQNEIKVDLQHHHIPKMADAGVLDYDVRSQTIRYHGNERLETAYDRVQDLTVN